MPSPARVRWAKFRTITVSLVALTILGVLFYLLTGGTLFEQKASIHMYMPDAAGLQVESPVRVNGISVGQVSRISFSGSTDPHRVVRVDMVLSIENLTSIPNDSYAEISTDTLIGDKFVDITSGRSLSVLRPGGELNFKEQPDMLKSIDMQQLEANLRTAEQTLTEIENGTSPVGKFIKGEELHDKIVARVKSLSQKMREATSTTGEIGQFIYTDALYRQLRDPLQQLDLALAKLQSGQGELGRLLRDPAMYEQAVNGAENIRRQIADIRSTPLLQSEAAYEGWIRTLDNLVKMVDDFNAGPMFAAPATYENLTGTAKELRDTMKDFRENPKKYLRYKLF